MSRPKINYLVALVISSCILLMGFTYNELPIEKEDQKKLEKAQKLNSEAQELNDKANSLYSEIANIDTSDPKSDKKAENLKIKALDFQLDALELQKEANFLEYNVFKKIQPGLKQNFQKNNEVSLTMKLLEERSVELFYKAEKLRNEAYNMDKDERESRFEKLNEAQEFEKEGLEKQKLIIDIYTGKSIVEDKENLNKSADEKIVLNDDLLKSYMNYMKQEDSKTAMESLIELISSDSLSSTTLRRTLETFVYIEPAVIESEVSEQDISAEVISEEITSQSKESFAGNENISEKEEKNIIYKVQIAADKNVLTQNVLKKMYSGNKEIKMINENGWNKYSIGDFESFAEADAYRKKIGVEDAFVVGYEDGLKVDLLAVNKENKKPVVKKETPVLDKPSGTIFKVQIAADKSKLSTEVLKNIYSGEENVDIIEEDGWYKYSVGKLSTYEQAIKLKSTVETEGAFIVAYNNGIKVPLSVARGVKTTGKTSSEESVVFKVQIAADTRSLSSEDLHKIYSGYENIQKYEEDGWSKYSVGEFKSFEEANKFRVNCGVKGAFVIAFKGDKKINVLEAKRMSDCFEPQIIENWLDDNNVYFKVQIAASANKMSIEQLKHICCTEQNIYLIKEDDWFKYSIGNYTDYLDAVKLKDNIKVSGAFIVAYGNGKKLSVKEAQNINKKNN